MIQNRQFVALLVETFMALPAYGPGVARLSYRIRRVLELRYRVIV